MFSCDEWSPLREVVVGTAHRAMFPAEDRRMVEATMPREHWDRFTPGRPFPPAVVREAELELDALAELLAGFGCRVQRPATLPWPELGGYCAAMPRDCLLVVGERIVEAPMAWRSRRHESRAYRELIRDWQRNGARWLAASVDHTVDLLAPAPANGTARWVINDTRPAWDAADFLRLGPGTVVGQLSHVTNPSGVADLRKRLGSGTEVHMLDVDDLHAMHIDATLCPLREGLALYNPERLHPEALRETPLATWELVPAPTPEPGMPWPPRFMTSPWVSINLLVVDDRHVITEAGDEKLHTLLATLGMTPVPCPFRHVQALGGSFHCATLDTLRG